MNAPEQPPRVAIIGAGFSGLAAAIALRRKGIEDFVIFEQATGLGGTWWHNRYPGAEVDLESHVYSYSYERSDWTRTHAGWRELRDYLSRVAHRWDLPRRVKFDEKVVDVRWSDETLSHTVSTSSGADHGEFTAVISAVGFLNVPTVPSFARDDNDFAGAMCHTSAWPEGLDLTGKSVGIVGTGSSAVQVVAEAEKVAAQVTIFQREPNWVVPKNSRDFTPRERRLHELPLVYACRRWALYLDYDRRQVRSSHARATGWFNRRRHQAARAFMQRELASRPDLLDAVMPAFAFDGKRTVVSDTYYAALLSPKVTLVPHGVKGLTRSGAIDANGDEHQLDVIVLATGFDAANYLGSYRVYGVGGRELHDTWQGEPQAFLGMMVPGFPNFFIMYGPNTNAAPLVHFYEAQANFAAALIDRASKTGRRVIEVRRSAFTMYNVWVQAQLAKTVWATTDSYFRAGTGKVVSQWPFGATPYIVATKVLRRVAIKLS